MAKETATPATPVAPKPPTPPPYTIKVTIGAEIPGITPAVSDTRSIAADTLIQTQKIVPANGELTIPLMPEGAHHQPAFLLIRPIKIGSVDVKKPEDLDGLNLTYATAAGAPAAPSATQPAAAKGNPGQYGTGNPPPVPPVTPVPPATPQVRKRIYGTHLFANGMAEWVTEKTAEGVHGPLTALQFWNKTGPVQKDGKDAPDTDGSTGARAVTVLIVVGYSLPTSPIAAALGAAGAAVAGGASVVAAQLPKTAPTVE